MRMKCKWHWLLFNDILITGFTVARQIIDIKKITYSNDRNGHPLSLQEMKKAKKILKFQ